MLISQIIHGITITVVKDPLIMVDRVLFSEDLPRALLVIVEVLSVVLEAAMNVTAVMLAIVGTAGICVPVMAFAKTETAVTVVTVVATGMFVMFVTVVIAVIDAPAKMTDVMGVPRAVTPDPTAIVEQDVQVDPSQEEETMVIVAETIAAETMTTGMMIAMETGVVVKMLIPDTVSHPLCHPVQDSHRLTILQADIKSREILP